jgi:glutamate formiminotransferase/glutamate formiminotransferase/formiminotetrahydrofolate cyclodeaminase
MQPLLAVPNVSEGCDQETIQAIAAAFAEGAGVRLLDLHSDASHQRSVYTLAGTPGTLADALLAGARLAAERVDIRDGRGVHPHVGALDVVPIVYLDESSRGAACAEALVVADRIGHELGIPVFLYGVLAGGRTRAQLRRGGVKGLGSRMASGDCLPDFGPLRPHPSAGAVLVAARPPLVAFNVQLAPPATLQDAQRIAAVVRDGGSDGLPGVRAIGVALASHADERDPIAQVSTNVEDPGTVALAAVIDAVAKHAPVASAELVGLTPQAAMIGFPAELPMPGFDPSKHVIENVLGES